MNGWKGLIALLVLVVGLGFGGSVQAIGISPVRILSVLEPNTREERVFYLSRSDVSREERYDVIASAEFIDLGDRTEVVMPAGVAVVPYYFSFDATNLAIGSYTGALRFNPTTTERAEGANVTFLIQVQGDVQLDVVSDVPEPVSLFGRDVSHIRIQNIAIEQVKNHVRISFQLHNIADEPVDGLMYTIAVLDANGSQAALAESSTAAELLPGDLLTRSLTVNVKQPGAYTVRISANSAQQDEPAIAQLSFRLSNTFKYLTIVSAVTGVVLTISGLYIILSKKRS